jgi:hypothetical protein
MMFHLTQAGVTAQGLIQVVKSNIGFISFIDLELTRLERLIRLAFPVCMFWTDTFKASPVTGGTVGPTLMPLTSTLVSTKNHWQ